MPAFRQGQQNLKFYLHTVERAVGRHEAGCAQEGAFSTVAHNGCGKTPHFVEYPLLSTGNPHRDRERRGRLYLLGAGLAQKAEHLLFVRLNTGLIERVDAQEVSADGDTMLKEVE